MIYLGAIRSASLAWLIEFARSARSDYEPEGTSGPTAPEQCLVTRESVGPIVDLALTAMRTAATDRRLLAVPKLIYVLYSWRRFNGSDPTEVRAWTDELLKDDQAVLTLMCAFIGKSYGFSMGFGGMADRVSKAPSTCRFPTTWTFWTSSRSERRWNASWASAARKRRRSTPCAVSSKRGTPSGRRKRDERVKSVCRLAFKNLLVQSDAVLSPLEPEFSILGAP